MKKIIDIWAPTLVWALLIFSFSALPANPVTEIQWKDFLFKKSLHITFYGVLTILFYRSFRGSKIEKKKAALYSILFTILYGISDEYHQSLTPGRDPQMRDVIFDAIGSFAAIYLLKNILPKVPPRLKEVLGSLNID